MCGIAGILNLYEPETVPFEWLEKMLAPLQHRGPDGTGFYRDEWVGLGNTRLSIIDIEGGDQPIANEDETFWIVFNGEIFNYVELRPGLEKLGHHFRTNSDTEVILHLYEEYGPDCLRFLNGQFAIAIWDHQQKNLFLARDRIGIRPLFYKQQQGKFLFGSEIKAILAVPEIQREIDLTALAETFTFWSPLIPRSIFKDIGELPPAHYLMVGGGKAHLQRYWSMDFIQEEPARSVDEYTQELESLLVDATRIRLRADVPVGAYLSGGVDSSLITALVHGYTQNRLDSFSISFSDPAFDESTFQLEMAKFLGTDHHVVACEYKDIGEAFPEVIWHTEVPILRTAPVPMFLLSKLARQNHFKVVMTGEGADEFLAGYDIFKEMKIRRFWAKNPESTIRPRLLSRIYPDIGGFGASAAFLSGFFRADLTETTSSFYSHLVRWRNTARTKRFFLGRDSPADNLPDSSNLPAGFSSWSELGQAQYLEVTTFLSSYLLSSQGDRMAMAHSVEGRYPFLDYRVIEFCNRLPPELKMPVLNEKWLLKQLGKRYLPESIRRRLKKPYRAPIQRSFFDPVPLDYVDDLLSETAVQRAGLFEPHAVARLFQKVKNGMRLSEVEDMALVGILSAQLVDAWFIRNLITWPSRKMNITRQIDRTGG